MSETPDPSKSLYDPVETSEEDLWFLPGPPEDRAPTDPPWTIADRAPLVEVQDWLKTEASLAVDLARAVAAFAALDERMRRMPPGVRNRMALREVSNLSWAVGTRLPVERIALYDLLRESSAGTDVRDLQEAHWALRRLRDTTGPLDWPDTGLEGFLGRVAHEDSQPSDYIDRPTGSQLVGLAEEWTLVLDRASRAHALTRAALGFFAWRAFEMSGPGEVLEGVVVTAKLGAEEGRGGLPFLPLAGGDASLFRLGGEPKERLRKWYRSVEQSCLAGLMELDRLEDWQARAVEAVLDLSGKTPPKLIEALSATSVLSAEMAARFCGVSKAAALRNLVEFEKRGLVRETTGQGRYRFWSAAV